MKNKEKYASEIIEIACSGNVVAVSKVTGKPIACEKNDCKNCYRYNDFSFCDEERLKEWAESDYIEKLVISKKDRAFLEYFREDDEYIARDEGGALYTYELKPGKEGTHWNLNDGRWSRLDSHFDVELPMVKWSDSEPWLIKDLKQLEVVEEYE